MNGRRRRFAIVDPARVDSATGSITASVDETAPVQVPQKLRDAAKRLSGLLGDVAQVKAWSWQVVVESDVTDEDIVRVALLSVAESDDLVPWDVDAGARIGHDPLVDWVAATLGSVVGPSATAPDVVRAVMDAMPNLAVTTSDGRRVTNDNVESVLAGAGKPEIPIRTRKALLRRLASSRPSDRIDALYQLSVYAPEAALIGAAANHLEDPDLDVAFTAATLIHDVIGPEHLSRLHDLAARCVNADDPTAAAAVAIFVSRIAVEGTPVDRERARALIDRVLADPRVPPAEASRLAGMRT